MKKFRLILMLFILPVCALAQGAQYTGIAQTARNMIGMGNVYVPIPGASVNVCTGVYTGTACPSGGNVTVYSNQALTTALPQPLTADNYGNFTFWAAPGAYYFTVTGQGAASSSYQLTLPFGVSGTYNATAKSIEQALYADQFCATSETYDQSCVSNAVAALSSVGGIVYLGPHTYTILSPIVVSGSAVAIVGVPQSMATGSVNGPSVLKEANGANLSSVIKLTGNDDVLRDLTVDGNKANQTCGTPPCDGIWYLDSERPALTDVSVQNAYTDGLWIDSSSTATHLSGGGKLTRVMALAAGSNAIRITNTADTFVSESEAENSNVGLFLDSAPTTRIVQSDFGGNTTNGIKCSGVASFGGAGGVISSSQFGNNNGDDISIDGWDSTGGAANACNYFTLSGNEFISSPNRTANTYAGIHVTDSQGNTVTGNTMTVPSGANSFKYDVEVSQSATTEGRDLIAGNRLSGWGTQAILSLPNTAVFANATGSTDQPETATALTVQNNTAANTALTVQGASGQSGDLLSCDVDGGSAVARINPAGVIYGSYLSSLGNAAQSGFERLANADALVWRNAANTGDVQGLTVTSADQTQLGDSNGATVPGTLTLAGGGSLASGKTLTNNGTISGGTVNATTLQQGGASVALASQLPLSGSVAGSTTSLAANTCGDVVTQTVTGATTTMTPVVTVSGALPTSGLVIQAAVTATNTVSIEYCNVTTGSVIPAAATLEIRVVP